MRFLATFGLLVSTTVVAMGCEAELQTDDGSGGALTDPEGRERPDGVPIFGTDDCRPPSERVWQLTPAQLAYTYEALLEAPESSFAFGEVRDQLLLFANLGRPYTAESDRVSTSTRLVSELLNVSAQAYAAADPQSLPGCALSADDAGCAQRIVDEWAPLAFRRPLTQEEKDHLLAFHAEHDGRALLRRILLAPETLFRFELGTLDEESGVLELSPHEIATSVSYTLTDGPPDAELRAAAEDGRLVDEKGLREQVERLLAAKPEREELTISVDDKAPPRRMRGIMRFIYEWLDVDRTRIALIDDKLLARPLENTLRWLDNEVMLLGAEVLWGPNPTLEELLSADYTLWSNTLADHYRYEEPFEKPVPSATADGRRGVLMQASFLVGHQTTTTRGLYVRERLFCQPVSAPPDVDMNLSGLEAELEEEEATNLSPREVRQRHMTNPACSSCHQQLDPLGYPFDAFDEAGLPRTEVDGFSIDTAGAITGTSSTDGEVDDAVDMVLELSQSADVRECFVRQMYSFVHGRPVEQADSCYLASLEDRFEESGGDIVDLLVHMLLGPEATTRMPIWKE